MKVAFVVPRYGEEVRGGAEGAARSLAEHVVADLGWEAEALGRCIQAVAQADYDVKGGGRDPVYAVERAILTIARERHGGR